MRLAPLTFLLFLAAPAAALSVSSPDGALVAAFELTELEGKRGVPVYRVAYDGAPLILESRLGLDFAGSGPLASGLEAESSAVREADSVAAVPFGKTSQARDHYRELSVALKESAPPFRRVVVTLRAYDDGFALRYTIPRQDALSDFTIKEELTRFAFAGNPDAYYLALPFGTPYEDYYQKAPLREIALKEGTQIALPMLLRYPNEVYAAITEAALLDYAGLYLGATDRPGVFVSRLAPSAADPAVKAAARAPFDTPWRVVMAGRTPGRLLESNLVFNLNPPSRLADVSWIKPGKVVFAWWNGYAMPDSPPFVSGVNTATIKRYIDEAAEHGIPYVSIDGTNDEAWYGGPVGDYQGQDLTRANPRLDMPAVLAYAKDKDVKVRLWMHADGLKTGMDRTLDAYEKWGISGIMVDFVNGDSQEKVRFMEKVALEASKRRLTVNYHGSSKPTGIERLYPNILSYEGVLGTEYNKFGGPGSTPEHEMLTLFIRMLAGPLDPHQGSFHPVVPEKFVSQNFPMTMGTLIRQVASYICYQNPLSMLADAPDAYKNHPLVPFIAAVPTTWDETKVLDAAFGERLTVARRKGGEWFVGAMADRAVHALEIPLNFLGPGSYVAESYSDGPDADADPKQYAAGKTVVTAADTLHVRLARAGGYALRLRPQPTTAPFK